MSSNALRRLSPLIVATAAVWLLSYVVWMASATIMAFPNLWATAGRRLWLCLVGAGLCWLLHLALRPLRRPPQGHRLATALPMAVLAAALYIFVEHRMYHSAWLKSVTEWYYLYRLNITGIAALWTFLTWCGVYFALQVGADLRDNELRLREAETMAVDAQNRMLRYQINPHFLFNIHNALSTLIHDGANEQAERMLLSLSGFLRRSLEKDPLAKTQLAEEVTAVREYLGIEKLRFGERLQLVERVDPGLGDVLTPSFILQPLVENAVKHGLGATSTPVTIEIGARAEGPVLQMWVRDDGPGATEPGAAKLGVGLQNVRRRLLSIYGPAAGLTAEVVEPQGFSVTLKIPLERD